MAKPILLAEDSRDDEVLFKFVLKKAGVENPVMVVRDGHEVILYLLGECEFADRVRYPFPEILFLDLKMPRVDGFAVLEWLNARPALRGELLIIVLTQFADATGLSRAYELGADSFLSKPFTQQDWENLMSYFSGYWMQSDTGGRGLGTGKQ